MQNELSQLDWLEAEAIHIMREVAGQCSNPVLLFSGGKDSTFTLYYLVKNLGLKCLVVRFDHLFMRPIVEENAIKTFKLLGVDVIKFSPNPKIVKMLRRQI